VVVFAGVGSPGVALPVVAVDVVGGTVFPAASKASAEAISLACCFFNFAAAFLAFFLVLSSSDLLRGLPLT
jgi:hypothetical protein